MEESYVDDLLFGLQSSSQEVNISRLPFTASLQLRQQRLEISQ